MAPASGELLASSLLPMQDTRGAAPDTGVGTTSSPGISVLCGSAARPARVPRQAMAGDHLARKSCCDPALALYLIFPFPQECQE